MAENQAVNGGIWNNEAAVLLKKLGWDQVGDSEVDIPTDEEKYRGIDRIMLYEDGRRSGGKMQTVYLEAKRYATGSMSKPALEEWFATLNTKLTKTKHSESFLALFPRLKDTVIKSGLIVIWFSDIAEDAMFRSRFAGWLKEVRLPTALRRETPNNLYVLDNDHILRLASLVRAIEDFNQEKNTEVKFYYPQSDNLRNPASRSSTLSLDMMFSKVVFAEAIVDNITHRLVFNFGELEPRSFSRLKSLLDAIQFIDRDKPLTIFNYASDINFRIIASEVKRLFPIEPVFGIMERYADLPTFMRLH